MLTFPNSWLSYREIRLRHLHASEVQLGLPIVVRILRMNSLSPQRLITIIQTNRVDLILNMRYPPYTASKEKRTTLVVPKLPARPKGPPGKTVPIPWGKRVLLAMAFVAVAIVAKRKYALVK